MIYCNVLFFNATDKALPSCGEDFVDRGLERDSLSHERGTTEVDRLNPFQNQWRMTETAGFRTEGGRKGRRKMGRERGEKEVKGKAERQQD